MAQVTLTIPSTTRLWWSSPMLVCANRNHVHGEYGWSYDDGSINNKAGLRPRFVSELFDKFRPAWGSTEYGRNTFGYRFGHEPIDGTNRLGDRGWNGFFFDEVHTKSTGYPYDGLKYVGQEFVDFGATATWVVNFGSAWLRHGQNGFSAPEHNKKLVQWLNDPVNTSRSTYWRADPLNVKWFEMGNEMSMTSQFGHGTYLSDGVTLDTSKPHFASSPARYAEYGAKIAHAMHQADAARSGGPLGIKCMFTTGTGLHFDGNGGWGMGNDSYAVVKALLDNAWTDANGNKTSPGVGTLQLDGFIVHSYPSWPVMADSKNATLKQKMAMMSWAEPKLASARQAAIDHGDGRTLPWVNTESFTKWYQERDQRYAGAMYGIDVLMTSIRNGFVFNNAFCLYHGRNNDDEVWFYNGDPFTPTALGTFIRDAFVRYWGDECVEAKWATGTCPTWTHTYNSTTVNVEHLGVCAAKSGDGTKLYVMILNRTTDTDHTVLLRQGASYVNFAFDEAAPIRMAKLTFTGTDPELDVWSAFKFEDRVLTAANGLYHVLTAERGSAAIYEITLTGGTAPTPPAAPDVTAVTPTAGPVGTLVEITGTGFSAIKAENEIRFGGAAGALVPEADKVSASTTKLVVRVPFGATTGGVYVKVGGQADTGPTFTVQANAPRIDRVEPMAGVPGDAVRIYGEHFNPADLAVTLGLLPATVSSATSTEIACTVPSGAVDAPVVVKTNGYTAETAGIFDIIEPVTPEADGPQAPPESEVVVSGIAFGRVFVDTTPIDGEAPWMLDWTGTDWGDVDHPEPQIIPTTGGSFTVYPMDTVMKPRKGKVVVYAECDDELHKAKLESELKGLLAGRRTLSNGSRHLEVQFLNAREVSNESRKAAKVVGVEAQFIAPDPRWKLNQPIKGVFKATRLGPQFGIFDDQMVPMVMPEYEFETPTFTIQNWGTAWTWAAGHIQNGPPNTVVYLRGHGEVRAKVVIDGNGNGTFNEGHEFFLRAGRNAIRVEKLNGHLIDPPTGFTISFADTTMRFL